MNDSLTYSVEQVAKILGISRPLAFKAVHTGDIKAIRIGRRILIPKHVISEMLMNPDNLPIATENKKGCASKYKGIPRQLTVDQANINFAKTILGK